MTAILEAESKLTDRYQTTVPEPVRRALKLGKRDRIHYTIRSDGEVVLTRAGVTEDEDPAIGAFLYFLARDMADHPQRLQAVDTEFARRIQSLTADIDIDLGAPLPADDE
jgi:antitoxin PrlF